MGGEFDDVPAATDRDLTSSSMMDEDWTIIKRKGLVLVEVEGGENASSKPFCFVSFNIPEVTYIQEPWRLPTRWEQRDALTAVFHQGGRVARVYPFSVYDPTVADRPCHIHFDGTSIVLNETYFVALDHCLDIARQLGLRLIIPFVDQWSWMGGIASYARFRGYTQNLEEAFWNEEVLRDDFKVVIASVIKRTNTVNGIPYKDDPTIFAWETGNELNSTSDWTITMAKYIKSLDAKHLVIDGHFGVDEKVLDEDSIDIISSHYYPHGTSFAACLTEDLKKCQGKKPFYVGEFGFAMIPSTKALLQDVVIKGLQGQGVIGAMLWSLRFRSKEGGFYWHQEPCGFGVYWAYHWPGFDSGERYDERAMMDLLRQYGYKAQGLSEVLPLPRPGPPTILSVSDCGLIKYRGSTSARSYELQRARSLRGGGAGDWTVIKQGVHDAKECQKAEILDEAVMRLPPPQFFYRLIAINEAGRSAPSGIVPLLLPPPWSCDPDAVKPSPPIFYFADPVTRNLLQLAKSSSSQHSEAWETIDLTRRFGAQRVGEGGVSAFGPEGDTVVYCGWNEHLYEVNVKTGATIDHSASFKLRIAGAPSVWPGTSILFFRAAKSNHICSLQYRPQTKDYQLEDYCSKANAPVCCSGPPVAASEQDVLWVGENMHLYHLHLGDLAITDHTARSHVRVRGTLGVSDRCKVFFVGAQDGHLYGESLLQSNVVAENCCGREGLIEQTEGATKRRKGDDDSQWITTNHSKMHGAPPVAGPLEVIFQGAKVVYRSAEDMQTYELWYCGEDWRVTNDAIAESTMQ